MIIIETPIFTKQIQDLIPDENYGELQELLIHNPKLGKLIPQSHGLRKVRWSTTGRGKRGGIRVIYYWYTADDQIYMLLAYAKNKQENLTTEQLKVLKQLVEQELTL